MCRDLAGLDVPRETLLALHQFWKLVRRWSTAIQLVAPIAYDVGWHRHIIDSCQVALAFPARDVRCIDLGSGGGLPMIPVALLRRSFGYVDSVVFVEVDGRKGAFLRSACRTLGIPATVVTARAERLSPLAGEVITVRAMAPLERLLPLLDRHGAPGFVALLQKGARVTDELVSVRTTWSFDVRALPSVTSQDGVILAMTEIRPKYGP